MMSVATWGIITLFCEIDNFFSFVRSRDQEVAPTEERRQKSRSGDCSYRRMPREGATPNG